LQLQQRMAASAPLDAWNGHWPPNVKQAHNAW
jgi:hypothetical protein